MKTVYVEKKAVTQKVIEITVKQFSIGKVNEVTLFFFLFFLHQKPARHNMLRFVCLFLLFLKSCPKGVFASPVSQTTDDDLCGCPRVKIASQSIPDR